jgi:hypothetical protein
MRCQEASTEIFHAMFGKPHTKPAPAEKNWEQGLRGGGCAGSNLRPLSGAGDFTSPLRKASDAERPAGSCAPRVYNEWKEKLEDAGSRVTSYNRRIKPTKEDNGTDIYRDILRAGQGGLISAVASANSRYSNNTRIRPGTAQPGSRRWDGDGLWPGSFASGSDLAVAPAVDLAHSSLFVGRGAGMRESLLECSHGPPDAIPAGAFLLTGRVWASATSDVNVLGGSHGGFPVHMRPTSGSPSGRAHRPIRQTAARGSAIPQSVLQSLHRREQQQQHRKAVLHEGSGPIAVQEPSQSTSSHVSIFSDGMSSGWRPRLPGGKLYNVSGNPGHARQGSSSSMGMQRNQNQGWCCW